MFVSVNRLHDRMGVDSDIARFFVDRKVPTDNAFWRKRLLYVGRGNGFISIPVYYDLLFRLGVPKEILLSEAHVQLMERIMHYAILVEFSEINFLQQLKEIENLLSNRIQNQKFFDKLNSYLNQPILKPIGILGMPIPALN